MIRVGERFLDRIKQYGVMETRQNRDFTEPVLHTSEKERQRLIDQGAPAEEATAAINQALGIFVQRFPVELPPLEG